MAGIRGCQRLAIGKPGPTLLVVEPKIATRISASNQKLAGQPLAGSWLPVVKNCYLIGLIR